MEQNRWVNRHADKCQARSQSGTLLVPPQERGGCESLQGAENKEMEEWVLYSPTIALGSTVRAPHLQGLWSLLQAFGVKSGQPRSPVFGRYWKKNRSGPNDFASCLIISCSKHPDLGNDIARQSPSNAASLWEQSVKSGLEGLFCGVRSSWLLFWCLPLGLICSPRTDIVRAYGQNRIHPRGCSTAAFSALSTSLLTSVTPAWRHWLGDSVRSHGLRASPLSGEKLHTELSSE